MSITPVGGTASPQPDRQAVTVRQPDGGTYTYSPPTATYDPVNKTWKAEPATGMTDLAKQVNRKYSQSLDADDFMKLLVAQLRYQDPTNPADTADMMQQSAAMAMVERVNEMTAATEAMTKASQDLVTSNELMSKSFATSLMEQRMASSVALVGRTVSYASADDPTVKLTGVVESVRFDEAGPILSVGGKDVPLASVSAVLAPPTPAAGGAPAPPAPVPDSGSSSADTAPSTGAPSATSPSTDTESSATPSTT